jgi:outer membrane protein OmpA-like peptidoglycan-associated protein
MISKSVSLGVALAACCGALACDAPVAPVTPAFEPPPRGAAVPLPAVRPPADHTLLLPTSKDQVAIELHPRVELRESVAADSDERSGLVATVVLTLPKNRVALRRVDVTVAVKRRPGGEIAESRDVSYSRETAGDVLTVALGKLGNGAYDVDVHTAAHVDVLDEDWSVMVDTKEATERAAMVIGGDAGKREQSKTFEVHFDSDAATPVDAERRTLDSTRKAIEALLEAHPKATARVDCWTSSNGEERQNRVLATRRCEWFNAEVWSRLSRTTAEPIASVPHSSSELAADERARDVKVQSRNRVVRLRVRWAE